jgi:hypothetical protein
MKRLSIILMVIFVLMVGSISASYANTNTNTITIEDLLKDPQISSTTRDAIAKAVNRNEKNMPIEITPDNLEKWQALGDAFAQTIATVCKTLNVEVNAFLGSDVGKLTAGIIIYKMVGKDIIRIGVNLMSIFILTILLLLFIKFVFLAKKIKVEIKSAIEGKKPEFEIIRTNRFNWHDNDAKMWTMICSIIVYILFIAILIETILQ